MKLFYIPLEAYESRYTLQLTDWNLEVFKRRKIDYEVINGVNLTTDQQIVTGQVLDAHGRSYYALSQIMTIVKLLKENKINNKSVLFFEDLFHPGLEALPYIFNQTSKEQRPKVFVRCLAQTIDPDDFVHVWDMYPWMCKFEHMVNDFVDGIFMASEEMVAFARVSGWCAPLYVTGLPFGKKEVLSRIKTIKPFNEREKQVIFAARWDQEKQPDFYMDLIEEYYKRNQNTKTKFCLLSGSKLRSNNSSYMQRTYQLIKDEKLILHENLTKNEYYNIVSNSRVLFNCALQDWVSNTVSEADTLGCNVLYPAYRSFPETFANDATRLYIPWSIDDALYKLNKLLEKPSSNIGKISNYQDKTIDRTLDIMFSSELAKKYARNTTDYRKYSKISKF